MSTVRVLVGTKKGAFILTADGARKNWTVAGPHSPAGRCTTSKDRRPIPTASTPRRRAAGSGRSSNARMTAAKRGIRPAQSPRDLMGPDGMPKGQSNMFNYEGSVGTHKWYDGTQHPWEFKRVWHIEPSLTDPDTAYAGVEDAAIFKTTDGGKTWKEMPTLRSAKGNLWQPGAGGMAVHTIILDPRNPQRIYIAISAAGAFRTDDGGTTWKPINRGLKSQYELPDPDAEVGHCVHRIALHPSRPDVLYMQKHWDIMRSDNSGDQWSEVSGNLPTDFGFPIDVHAHEPETIYVVPITSDSLHYPPDGKLRVYRSKTGGKRMGAADEGPAATGLLCERAARRDGRGPTRPVRCVFRHHGRPGLLLAGRRRFLEPNRARSTGRVVCRGADVDVREMTHSEWIRSFGIRLL